MSYWSTPGDTFEIVLDLLGLEFKYKISPKVFRIQTYSISMKIKNQSNR